MSIAAQAKDDDTFDSAHVLDPAATRDSQGQISEEIAAVHAQAQGETQPRLDFPPYRSSVFRHPTKSLVHADPVLLQRILVNLLSNARRYTPEGTPIHVSTSTFGDRLEIRIVDPVTFETVPRGTPGEFWTKGYSVMLGYWGQDDKTAEAIVDGWMRTGDLGVMDDDGYVQITGRIKDMVIRGGENVYPREIEEFLYTHPDILDAQVVGVPDEKYGEELCAWIRMREGAPPLDAGAVREFATGKLAHYKIPRYVKIVDDFPNPTAGEGEVVG